MSVAATLLIVFRVCTGAPVPALDYPDMHRCERAVKELQAKHGDQFAVLMCVPR